MGTGPINLYRNGFHSLYALHLCVSLYTYFSLPRPYDSQKHLIYIREYDSQQHHHVIQSLPYAHANSRLHKVAQDADISKKQTYSR